MKINAAQTHFQQGGGDLVAGDVHAWIAVNRDPHSRKGAALDRDKKSFIVDQRRE